MPEGSAGPLGSVEQEARKLVGAAAEWVRAYQQPGSGASGERHTDPAGAEAETPQGEGHREETCQGCPWCRARSTMGPVGADALESLADLLASASQSLRLFAESRRSATPDEPDAQP